MEIQLLTCTPNFLKVIWCAARTCYSHLSPLELWHADPSPEEMLRLVRNIIRSGHLSVTEHCSMTFAVEGVSRALLAQYSRHRIGVSLSVQSQRHVSAEAGHDPSFPHVVPPKIAGVPEAAQAYRQELLAIRQCYDRLIGLGIKKEDARFILPQGAKTNFVTTLNLRSFMDVYHKRVVAPGAQWEIREMLKQMAELVIAREPWLSEFIPL